MILWPIWLAPRTPTYGRPSYTLILRMANPATTVLDDRLHYIHQMSHTINAWLLNKYIIETLCLISMTLLLSKTDGYELLEVSPNTDLYSRQHSFVEKGDWASWCKRFVSYRVLASRHIWINYIHFCCTYIGPTNIHLYAHWPSYEAYQLFIYIDDLYS